LLRRAEPLLRRGPVAPVRPSPGRGPQRFRRHARKLLESFPLHPEPYPCRNRAEDRRRYSAPPSKFLTAGDLCALLTPSTSPQEPPGPYPATQRARPPRHRHPPRAPPPPPHGHRRRPLSAAAPATPSPW
jgi:hypothetical protein